MKRLNFLSCFVILAGVSTFAAETGSLDSPLEPLRAFLGKTWRGEFKGSTAEKPTVDVARWERALNGKAVRVLHSVNDGTYGGESILRWDSDKKELAFFYFTTAGFFTSGTMVCTNKQITCVEKVSGDANRTKEVRSTYTLQEDGAMLNKTVYLAGNGEVVGGREVLYKESPGSEVRFK